MKKRCPGKEMKTLEALLFASGEPVSLREMMRVLGLEEKQTERLTVQLKRIYDQKQSGVQIERLENRFQKIGRAHV